MDWSLALTLNRIALLRVAAALFALAGFEAGGTAPETLPRHVYRAILKTLRPAEAALRRLIFIAAVMLGEPDQKALRSKRPFPAGGIPRGDKKRTPSFPLFDPRKVFEELLDHPRRGRRAPGPGPRISSFDEPWTAYEAAVLSDEDAVNAAALCSRLEALLAALNDIPKQAKRMARAMARRRKQPPGPRAVGPLRFGFPPGHRKRRRREVHEILRECQALAMIHPKPPDLKMEMFAA